MNDNQIETMRAGRKSLVKPQAHQPDGPRVTVWRHLLDNVRRVLGRLEQPGAYERVEAHRR